MRFQIEFLSALEPRGVIERQMAGFFVHSIAKYAAHPEQVLPEFRFPDPCEPNPKPALIERQQSPAPTQQGFLPIDCFQINHVFNLERVPADHDDVPVHCCEIDFAVAYQSVVRRLYSNINAFVLIR